MVSYAVVRYKAVLGARDSTTGHCDVLYSPQTIKMNVYPKGSPSSMMPVGRYCRFDAVGYTDFQIAEDDVILWNSKHLKIVGRPQPWYNGLP